MTNISQCCRSYVKIISQAARYEPQFPQPQITLLLRWGWGRKSLYSQLLEYEARKDCIPLVAKNTKQIHNRVSTPENLNSIVHISSEQGRKSAGRRYCGDCILRTCSHRSVASRSAHKNALSARSCRPHYMQSFHWLLSERCLPEVGSAAKDEDASLMCQGLGYPFKYFVLNRGIAVRGYILPGCKPMC